MKKWIYWIQSVCEIRWSLQSGESFKKALTVAIQENKNPWTIYLSHWLFLYQTGKDMKKVRSKSTHENILLDVFHMGLQGEPVEEHLSNLEKQMKASLEREMDTLAKDMPFKMMLPLFLFQVPAFLVLFLGPLLKDLLFLLEA